MTNSTKVAKAEKLMMAKIEALPVKNCKEMLEMLKDDFSDEGMHVMNLVLKSLMARMPEDKFVAMCDAL